MSKYQRQIEIENQCLSIGRERYFDRVSKQKTVDGSIVDNSWISRNVRAFSEYIAEAVALNAQKRTTNRKDFVSRIVSKLDPVLLSQHTLRTLLNPALRAEGRTITSASLAVSSAILTDINYSKLALKDIAAYQAHQKVLDSSKRRRMNINQLMAKAGIAMDNWEKTDKVRVGFYLIDLAIQLFGCWKITKISRGKFVRQMVVATPELIEWIENAHEFVADTMPIKLPMVHPPLRWADTSSGGYLTDIFKNVYVIRTFDKAYIESLESVELSEFYRAINSVQETAYSINTAVLDVAQWAWDSDILIGKEGKEVVPKKTELELPEYPKGYGDDLKRCKLEDPAVYKKWQRSVARTYDKNKRMVSKRIAADSTLKIAQQFRDEKVIYFPHNADFRGRIYPIPNYLTPQGNDLSKGLLQFAEGVPLGEDGAYWLHVHAANCWGVDKVSNDERVLWTEDKLEYILESAMNPKDGNCFWMEADKPLSALAVAFELLRYQVHGDEMVSHLPIPMDGSCNGLQHFSAMLQDSVGAKATNLAPGDMPSDIYQEVADLVVQQVHKDALAGNPVAIIWEGHITRSTVKQPVMTLPYGATINGMREQVLDWLNKEHPNLFDTRHTWESAGYMAGITQKAINKVVVAAQAAMKYLKDVAKVLSKHDLPVTWNTQIGFPVLQHYKQFDSVQHEMHIRGKRTRFHLQKDSFKLDKRRQALGIAPNFVHSLDSSHLMLTVLECVANDITSFSMVHDSYATHAANTSVLHACIREAFVDMHETDVLRTFHAELKKQLPDKVGNKLPNPPERGDFDLDLVRGSQYFFA